MSSGLGSVIISLTSLLTDTSSFVTTEQFTGLVSFIVATGSASFVILVTLVALYALDGMSGANSLTRATSKSEFNKGYHALIMSTQWGAYSFNSLFILDVATESPNDHKLFSATYIFVTKNLAIKI